MNNQKKTFSLEEKSKSSKKRVHYMKFAKGKRSFVVSQALAKIRKKHMCQGDLLPSGV